MSIDKCVELKAPESKYAVCDWDPSNPRKSVPSITQTLTTKRDAVYTSLKYAEWYTDMRNKLWKQQTQKIGELEYFVIDAQGKRVC